MKNFGFAQVQAQRFRRRAAECLALADMTEALDLAERYRDMARRYEDLAEREEDAVLPSRPEADAEDPRPPGGVTI